MQLNVVYICLDRIQFGSRRIDVCEQELSVTETYTSLNHSNKRYIITVLTTLLYIYIYNNNNNNNNNNLNQICSFLTSQHMYVYCKLFITVETAVTRWLRRCATNQKVTGLIPDGVNGIFRWQSFHSHYDPGVDSASNRNEYQEYFLGVKTAGA